MDARSFRQVHDQPQSSAPGDAADHAQLIGITFDQVDVEMEGRSIIKGLCLHASEPRIGLIGRNGSGKSTFARLFAGLLKPSSGTVKVAGVDVAADRRAALSTVGILFQNADHQIIFPTVEEELAFGLRQLGQAKDEAKERAQQILVRFGKAHWWGESVHRLSQGQKRLLCLMAVLAMQPKSIVLDEPFAGLDLPTQMQLKPYLDAAETQIVHITHEPAHVASAQRVLWLEDGALAADGRPDEVLPAYSDRMKQLGGQDDLSHLPG